MTQHLWEINHPYYCSDSNYYASGMNQPFVEYESWQDFLSEEGDSDFDMNLVFRWDWEPADPEEEREHDTLKIFWMGQRKGLFRATEVTVTKDDEDSVREWLQKRWAHMQLLWEGIA